ncbi:hypothetical protein T552_01685 [Pneumocystis carinii B80]|uniref:Ribosomal RNA-processing protein 8 n=1 Tax=Pneumocystis carinii (strain B80) TaxID=1408658 RepID=A0A0W4ZJ75_PNEC8|nr:hypothetical protein T552_01685 [Pneumocystis carinii B80]KTW28424.1 hypothetical protein T552_01685 [Pneumocystis carinii B80]
MKQKRKNIEKKIKKDNLKVIKSRKFLKKEKKISKNTQKQNNLSISKEISTYENKEINKSVEETNKNTQLTKLQQKMKLKLSGGKFRLINEHLYNITSREAMEFFKKNPEMYEVYHTGFQNQISSWPKNPIDLIIEDLSEFINESTEVTLNVADLGCGDAKIARTMKDISNIKVYSYDLVSRNSFVTTCDISNLPLKSSTIDIAIFCLSLMGTNYIDFLKEAWRILKMNGKLWIVEIKSRFMDNEGTAFCTALSSLGFSLVKKETSNKMFIYLYFKKTNELNEKNFGILLKSCIYKRR